MQQEPKLLRVSVAARELGLHPTTVRRWLEQGKLASVQVGREARIPRSEIERLVGTLSRRLIVYGRVSGHDQKTDLERQMERLAAWAKAERQGQDPLVLSDVGSGLSTTRPGLARLISLVQAGQVNEVVVTFPDRLTRFGFEYFERWFAGYGTRITALEVRDEQTPEQELAQDLLTIIASFAGKLYGRRSHQQKELVQCAEHVLSNP
jgi:putative resolvase